MSPLSPDFALRYCAWAVMPLISDRAVSLVQDPNA